MKRNILILLLAVLLCVAMTVSLIACSEEEPPAESEDPTEGEQPGGGEEEPPASEEDPDDQQPHEHDYGQWIVTKEATCGALGSKIHRCLSCGASQTEQIMPTGLHCYGAKNTCVDCNTPWSYSEGFSFVLNADGASYTVDGHSGSHTGELTLPCFYNGLPVTGIADHAFANMEDLTALNLTDYVTHIGNGALENCTQLAVVRFEKEPHLLGIGARAFANTALAEFEIPADVMMIGAGAFADCRSLETLKLAEGNCRYEITKGGALIDKATATLLRADPSGSVPTTGVSAIAAYAFEGCGTGEILIPESVTTLHAKAFAESRATKISFAVATGWYVTEVAGATAGTDPQLAEGDSATLTKLTETYLNYYWYRTVTE